MPTPEPVTINFTPDELYSIIGEAHKCCFERRYTWIENPKPELMYIQQLCGQLGQAGLSKLLYGTMDKYFEDRAAVIKRPYHGDGGMDIPNLPIDIKTTWATSGWDFRYNLWVPGWDWRPNRNYIFALVPKDDTRQVSIFGWRKGINLRLDPTEGNPRRRGCYIDELIELKPILEKYGTLTKV